ncbi:hypothetical protein [Flammeovirga agarivorans]|uniref:DUF4180 domain-containing protein n=1 Tax=Flammeovirga agarivorans TaxID=2726742 RepID=A0A7X8SI14_9BACT|nr:hypothetical protein [Flammeovirga agarivorans]NLR90595.1 hypothetical protein [Flammeovirga agarivorans]
MDYEIINNDDHILLTIKGEPDILVLNKALQESLSLVQTLSTPILFINGHQLNKNFKVFEKHHLISQLDEIGFSKDTNFFIMSDMSKEEKTLVETFGSNRSWKIKVFKYLDQVETIIKRTKTPVI